MQARQRSFDVWLLFSVSIILALGFIMVASASIPVAERMQRGIFSIAWHQAIFISAGVLAAFCVTFIPIKLVQKYNNYLLLLTFILLILVLIPGVSRPLNGSLRWLFVGPISIQPSEILKLSIILYMSGYMVRRQKNLRNLQGFLIPMLVLAFVGLLLMLEPDFGAEVVIASTILAMLFLGGVPIRYFFILVPFILSVIGVLAFSSSYRVQRFVAFQNPWADQFDSGYQLVQSLIAFGRGSWFGSGLGGSVQKLLYLPESHSDFIFAVLAEELGLFGVVVVLALYAILAYRAMEIGRAAKAKKLEFHGNLAYGLGLLISLQTIINISVNIGLLPTKGLTLPLMSAGGSSMIMACIAIGLLFRIDYESKL